MTNGVLYVALGQNYLNEARVSAESLRDCIPWINIAVVTDVNVHSNLFDEVIHVESPGAEEQYKPSFLHLHRTPYEKTIFLDTDTYIVADFTELFDLLDVYEFLAARAPYREQIPVGVPEPFTELNGGVVGYNSNPVVREFIDQWRETYEELKTNKEQPSLRKTLYESDLEFYILPPEYNSREMGHVDREVKIIHQRRDENVLRRVAEKINDHRYPRVFFYRWGKFWVVPYQDGLVKRTYDSLREEGVEETGRKAIRKLREIM